jgi:hypothetical protein
MENTKYGEMFFVASKHELTSEVMTCAATLVPPEPKPDESLTWEQKTDAISKRLTGRYF